MWEQHCFRTKNAGKLNSKFGGKGRNENVLVSSLYRSFVKNAQSKSSCSSSANSILSYVSFEASKSIEANLSPSEEITDDIKLLSVNIQCQANELKDLLKCVQSNVNTDDTTTIVKLIGDIFGSINPQQVVDICDCLELHKLDEVTFHSHFCQLFLQVVPPIGFSVGLCVVQHLLYVQVLDLKSAASRLLTATVLQWTKMFPKIILESVIIPCMEENHLEKFQVDLIIRLIKEGLSSTYVTICLRECLQACSTVDERHFLILQTIVEKKVNFEECWDTLLEKLLATSEKCRKNMVYTKLILTMLTKEECQLQPHHLHILSQIVNKNETFLKKSVDRALQNLIMKHSV